MQAGRPYQVLIVEDDEPTARLLQSALSRSCNLAVTGCVPTIRRATTFLKERSVDLVLFDLVLQGKERSASITFIKDQAPATKVLVLTAYEEPDLIVRALCAGADGYLLKSDGRQTVAAAVVGAMQSGAPLSRRVANAIFAHFHQLGAQQRQLEGTLLTPRQLEVLSWLRRGLTNKEIASRLQISAEAVKKHVEGICRRLRVENRTQAALATSYWSGN